MTPVGAPGSARSRVWREVADGIFVRRYPAFNVNSGLVLGDGEALVIDTRSSDRQGRELVHEIGWITHFPMRVVNTHHHFDHAFGNSAFLPTEIWGHERCAERIRDDGPRSQQALAASMPEVGAEFEETRLAPPDHLVRDAAEIEVGGRIVQLRHFGRGHTDNDLVVVVPDVNVVFAGDLVEEGAPPSFEDSYPLDWPGSLGRMLDVVHGPVVPGHGEIVGRAYVEGQVADLSALAELARRIRFDGGSVSDALPLSPMPPQAAREALRRAFSQLAGEL